MGMNNTFGQAHDLDIEDLLTRLLHIAFRRDEGMRMDITLQHEIMRHGSSLSLLDMNVLIDHSALSIDKRRVAATVTAQALHINLSRHELTL